MRSTKRIILITTSSLFGGGILYTIWLAAFLLLSKINGATYETLLWLLAPFFTALGFTSAVLLTNRLLNGVGTSFLSVYIWPLAGCMIGAVLVYWYGPMLIVFSMLAVGTLSVLLREIKLVRLK